MSKIELFKNLFLDQFGKSCIIKRYHLPEGLAYTSGDGIFRSDATLGKKYKFARFNKKFDKYLEFKISSSWRKTITPEEKEILIQDWRTMTFPEKGDKDYVSNRAASTMYIKFYGLAKESIINKGIRSDILKSIKILPCCSCGTTKDIECDHKNDLWEYNDKRIGIKEKQTLEDFQPLCKHCNDVKRAIKAKTMKEKKRQEAHGYPVKFVEGTEKFNILDPNWYKGTYWGDVMYFKSKLYIKK